MKKTVTVLLATLLVFVLAACGGSKNAAAGTYKLKSMTMWDQTFTVEELSADGYDMSDFSLELKENGDFTMKVMAGEGSQTVDGTWKADGGTVSLTAEGTTMQAQLDGNTMSVSQDGRELVFEK